MPKYFSPYWEKDPETGFEGCTKHGHPEVPCPQCMATADPDVSVTLTKIEKDWPDPEVSIRDLFPEGEAGDKLFARAR